MASLFSMPGLENVIGRSTVQNPAWKVSPMQLKYTWNIMEPTGKRGQGL
jgi:hypothetical protein